MKKIDKLTVTTPSEREIRVERRFDAPRELLFDAHTKPELIKRWLLGPGDWSMPVCRVDLRVGGRFRYVWSHPDKPDMGMGGVFLEINPPERIVHSEAFDDPWYPGECVVTTTFLEKDGRTTLTMTMSYETKEARDVALNSPMEGGIAAGYARLDHVLASLR